MIVAFHKPYGVLSQFTPDHPGQRTLGEFGFPKNVYPIGRLDRDSEGLLLLSDEKEWNDRLLNPEHAHERTYHAQVEGAMEKKDFAMLEKGVLIRDYQTRPCKVRQVNPATVYPPRNPPVRYRKNIPTTWIELKLIEGKNRQVRHMTAAVGFPTLRLIRVAIGKLVLGDLPAGKWHKVDQKFLMGKT